MFLHRRRHLSVALLVSLDAAKLSWPRQVYAGLASANTDLIIMQSVRACVEGDELDLLLKRRGGSLLVGSPPARTRVAGEAPGGSGERRIAMATVC